MIQRRMFSPSFAVIALLTCACLLPVHSQEAKPLTIEEAAKLAVAQNPSVIATRDELEAARSRIGIARSRGRLQVDATGQYIHTNAIGIFTIPGVPPRTVSAGTKDNTIGTVRARQSLYTGGRLSGQVDRAEALYDVALGRLGATEDQIALQTQEAYYNVLLGISLTTSAKQSLAAARQQLDVSTARFEAGTAAKFDVLRAQTQVSEAEQNLLQAQNQEQLARVALDRLLGVPLTQVYQLSVPGQSPFPSHGVESLVKTAESQRPELLSARAQVSAAEAGIRVARADRLPELGLSADYQVVGKENPGQATGYAFIASITQEILDGGRISASISEARALRNEAETNLQDTMRGVEQDVRQAYLNLETARKTLDTANARLAQAQEAYDIARVRYDAGVGTAVEIADALATLASARTNLDQASFNYNAAYARLQRALGNVTDGTPS